jgi:hypothetical protein
MLQHRFYRAGRSRVKFGAIQTDPLNHLVVLSQNTRCRRVRDIAVPWFTEDAVCHGVPHNAANIGLIDGNGSSQVGVANIAVEGHCAGDFELIDSVETEIVVVLPSATRRVSTKHASLRKKAISRAGLRVCVVTQQQEAR